MSYLRGSLLIVLALSLIANLILFGKYHQYRNGRPMCSVNGQSITSRDVDDYLEHQSGPNVEALLVERAMVDQEAQKQGAVPTEKEVADDYNNRKETDYLFARQVEQNPWTADDNRNTIRQNIEVQRLVAKQIPITQKVIDNEYRQYPELYDTPNKARAQVAALYSTEHENEIKDLMEKSVDPTLIMQQYPREVDFLGFNHVFTFAQPQGSEINSIVFRMKPGEVILQPPTPDAKQAGARELVVRLNEILPGHKADLNDPQIQAKIRVTAALRTLPPKDLPDAIQKYLYALWKRTEFVGETPGDKRYVEAMLFPTLSQSK